MYEKNFHIQYRKDRSVIGVYQTYEIRSGRVQRWITQNIKPATRANLSV